MVAGWEGRASVRFVWRAGQRVSPGEDVGGASGAVDAGV